MPVRNSRSSCTNFKIPTRRQTQKKKEKPCDAGVCRHKRWVLPDCLHWLVGNQSSGAWLTLKATHKYTHVCTQTHGIFVGLIRGNGRMFLRPHVHAHTQVLIESLNGQCESDCTRAWWCGSFWNRWWWARAGSTWIKCYYKCANLQC